MYYGANHPMKPHRLSMTHHLVMGYDLHEHMQIFVRYPHAAAPSTPPHPFLAVPPARMKADPPNSPAPPVFSALAPRARPSWRSSTQRTTWTS